MQRRRRHLKSGQATANKRSLVHVHEGGVHNSQCAAVKTTCRIRMRGCRCSPVGPTRAPDPPAKERERLRETRSYTQGKGELAWDSWPNRLVLRLSLQSKNETNDPLKSGPALAGPAGPATPPLLLSLLVFIFTMLTRCSSC